MVFPKTSRKMKKGATEDALPSKVIVHAFQTKRGFVWRKKLVDKQIVAGRQKIVRKSSSDIESEKIMKLASVWEKKLQESKKQVCNPEDEEHELRYPAMMKLSKRRQARTDEERDDGATRHVPDKVSMMETETQSASLRWAAAMTGDDEARRCPTDQELDELTPSEFLNDITSGKIWNDGASPIDFLKSAASDINGSVPSLTSFGNVSDSQHEAGNNANRPSMESKSEPILIPRQAESSEDPPSSIFKTEEEEEEEDPASPAAFVKAVTSGTLVEEICVDPKSNMSPDSTILGASNPHVESPSSSETEAIRGDVNDEPAQDSSAGFCMKISIGEVFRDICRGSTTREDSPNVEPKQTEELNPDDYETKETTPLSAKMSVEKTEQSPEEDEASSGNGFLSTIAPKTFVGYLCSRHARKADGPDSTEAPSSKAEGRKEKELREIAKAHAEETTPAEEEGTSNSSSGLSPLDFMRAIATGEVVDDLCDGDAAPGDAPSELTSIDVSIHDTNAGEGKLQDPLEYEACNAPFDGNDSASLAETSDTDVNIGIGRLPTHFEIFKTVVTADLTDQAAYPSCTPLEMLESLEDKVADYFGVDEEPKLKKMVPESKSNLSPSDIVAMVRQKNIQAEGLREAPVRPPEKLTSKVPVDTKSSVSDPSAIDRTRLPKNDAKEEKTATPESSAEGHQRETAYQLTTHGNEKKKKKGFFGFQSRRKISQSGRYIMI